MSTARPQPYHVPHKSWKLTVSKNGMEDLLKIMFVLIIAVFAPSFKPLIYFALCIYSFMGPLAVIQALSLSWVSVIATPAFGEGGGTALRFILVFCCFASVLFHEVYRRSKGPPKFVYGVVVFGIVVAVQSFFTSYALDVSLLKIISFTLGAVTILWATSAVATKGRLVTWFTALVAATLLFSLLFVLHPFGYLRNNSGFQGIFNHPQVMGVFAGVIFSWIFARIFISGGKSIPLKILLVISGTFMILSEARTGFLAAVLGILSAFTYVNRTRRVTSLLLLVLGGALAFLVVTTSVPAVMQFFDDFLRKGQEQEDFVTAALTSRAGLIMQSWENFLAKPYFGIGFGLPSFEEEFIVRYDPVLGLPVGASIEKGLFFTGLLEEIGLVGAFFFLTMMVLIFRAVLRRRDPAQTTLFVAAVATNLGEATLLSLGGNGLLIWLLIGLATKK